MTGPYGAGAAIADSVLTKARDDREDAVAQGTIKRVVKDKGFGFIRDDRGNEFFFHRSSVDGDFTRLNEGQHVDFDEEPSPKGPRAGHVRVAEP